MTETLIDRFGRRHNSLRISVTDRCNIRCVYCMPEHAEFLPKDNLLSFEEITQFVKIGTEVGIDKLRLTGGEPLVRRNLDRLIGMLLALPGIRDLSLTTNGTLLEGLAGPLFDAGLRRINISLDTLDREQFLRVTRRDSLLEVLRGIDAAQRVGFKIKINAIAMKDVTDNQVLPLATFCRERGLELRFIEFMPLEADRFWDRSKVFTADDIVRTLEEAGMPVTPLPAADPSAPASEYAYTDGMGKLGIVASVTRPFCGDCNRIRITAEGKLRNCLFALDEADIKTPLRAGDAEKVKSILRQSVADKWEGHQFNSIDYIRPERTMHTIGG